MREIRTYGSEGGAPGNRLFLPLSQFEPAPLIVARSRLGSKFGDILGTPALPRAWGAADR